MAGLSSAGVGSGLDINGLVTQLVAAEKAPLQAHITRQQTSTVTTISALGSLKGSLGAFNAALTPLKTLDSFSARSATSSEPDVFTASATTEAAAGSYDIEVVQVASAHQVSSSGFENGSSHEVGHGTLTVKVGSDTFSVGIPESANTLAEIRDAINTATGNENTLRATIVNANDGAHLVLTAVSTGEDNAISVSVSGGDGGLASLAYAADATNGYTQLRAAADSIVEIAGYAHNSASRTITGVLDGVTLTVLEGDAGEVHTLTIANDTSAVSSRIKTFVDQFNGLASQIAQLRSFEPTTRKAGPLLGDASLRGIETDVRSRLTDRVTGLTGNYRSLASIGITTTREGTLTLDSAKLAAALAADYDGVAAIFASSDGVAARLSEVVAPRLAAGSELDVRSKRLNAKSVELQKEQVTLEQRMLKVEQRYRAQFNALDGLLSRLQSTSSFLTQQLDSISKISINRE